MQMAKAVAESDRMADQREFERALKESQNDQLQRAIKESSLSVDHVSSGSNGWMAPLLSPPRNSF